MRQFFYFSLVIFFLASCSAPKYSYYFDYYKNSTPADAAKKSELQITQDEVIHASIDAAPVVSSGAIPRQDNASQITVPAARPIVNKQNSNPSRAEKREAKRELRAAVKELKGSIKEAKRTKEGKSQGLALVLTAFGLIGLCGIHRLYLGYIGIGILQILTLGGCGIWWIIDIIRLFTGDLKPKNGEYTKTL